MTVRHHSRAHRERRAWRVFRCQPRSPIARTGEPGRQPDTQPGISDARPDSATQPPPRRDREPGHPGQCHLWAFLALLFATSGVADPTATEESTPTVDAPLEPVYNVATGVRDPFVPVPKEEPVDEPEPDEQSDAADAAPQPDPTPVETEPEPVEPPPEPELEQRQVSAAISLNAVVDTRRGTFGIVNGQTVRVGESLQVSIEEHDFELEIIGLEAAPPKLLLKHNKNTFVCTLGTKGDK